jgi:four helix bundle suffix protein
MGRNGNHEKNGITGRSHDSHDSHGSQLLLHRGDYKTLYSYRKTEVIYEITHRFCRRFLARGDRTVDQMVQAARSGKQNIIEGSKAAATSTEMEIKLTNVARASMEELLEDYCDFLRVRDLPLWDKDGCEARRVRELGTYVPLSFSLFREVTESGSAEVVANTVICLIHQANYLIDRQLRGLEGRFLRNGGLRERMARARQEERKRRREWE